MDVLEFIFWSGCLGLFLAGAVMELLKIMFRTYKKERRFHKWKRKFTK